MPYYHQLLYRALATFLCLVSLSVTAQNKVGAGLQYSKCLCGQSLQTDRVINGKVTKVNEFPWTVALNVPNTSRKRRPSVFCGGTLINSKFVLTAAHCVQDMDVNEIEVIINEHDLLVERETVLPTYRLKIDKIIIHPDYDQHAVINDIALVKLIEELDLESTSGDGKQQEIRPVCLPEHGSTESLEGKTAWAAGWGLLKEGGSLATVLNSVKLPIISNVECNEAYDDMILDSMLCAGYPDGGKDTCQGDSGGPLVVKLKPDSYTLVGCVSWGYGCARPQYPGVYTRVAHYMDWIYDETEDAKWCSDKIRLSDAGFDEFTTTEPASYLSS